MSDAMTQKEVDSLREEIECLELVDQELKKALWEIRTLLNKEWNFPRALEIGQRLHHLIHGEGGTQKSIKELKGQR